jgi:phage-related protein
MKWEIKNNKPSLGDVRFKTRFAWLPTQVLSKITMTDHIIWLQLYIEEQEYTRGYLWTDPNHWKTIAKTIHI